MTATIAPAKSSRAPRPIGGLLRSRETPVAVALIVLVLFTYANNSRFLSAQGVKDLLLNSTIIVILAVGQALVIITQNVDLSVGSILGMVAFATDTLFATVTWIPIVVVLLIGMTLGALLGAIKPLTRRAAFAHGLCNQGIHPSDHLVHLVHLVHLDLLPVGICAQKESS